MTLRASESSVAPPTGSWHRWGPEDEVGAPNLIGPEQVTAATALVEHGRVITLGQPLGPQTPVPGHRKRVERLMMRDGGDYAVAPPPPATPRWLPVR
jgi:hypothetical protein